MLTLPPAHQDMSPPVVVTAVRGCLSSRRKLIAPVAVAVTLPPVVVMASNRFTSWPAISERLPPVVVIAAFKTTSLTAFNVKVVAAVQVSASLTKISPLPSRRPLSLRIVMLLRVRLSDSSLALMSPSVSAIVKSVGSINQRPTLPCADDVLTHAVSAMCTCAAEVSIRPPSPPCGADASSWPLSKTLPVSISPINRMLPGRCSSVWARMTPLLLTTLRLPGPVPIAVSST